MKAKSIDDAQRSGSKWFPFNKGGSYRKWYGNNDVVIAFDEESISILQSQGNHLPSKRFYFLPSVTWSKVSSGVIAFRYKSAGHLFGVAGGGVFQTELPLIYILALMNSSVIQYIASLLSPTLNYEVGQVASYPVIRDQLNEQHINAISDSNVALSRTDWDIFETSWNFKIHPLVRFTTECDRNETYSISLDNNSDKIWDYDSFECKSTACVGLTICLKDNRLLRSKNYVIACISAELTPSDNRKSILRSSEITTPITNSRISTGEEIGNRVRLIFTRYEQPYSDCFMDGDQIAVNVRIHSAGISRIHIFEYSANCWILLK